VKSPSASSFAEPSEHLLVNVGEVKLSNETEGEVKRNFVRPNDPESPPFHRIDGLSERERSQLLHSLGNPPGRLVDLFVLIGAAHADADAAVEPLLVVHDRNDVRGFHVRRRAGRARRDDRFLQIHNERLGLDARDVDIQVVGEPLSRVPVALHVAPLLLEVVEHPVGPVLEALVFLLHLF